MPFFVFVIVCIFAKHYFSKWRANKKEREENQAEKKEEIAENNNENQNASQKPEGEIAVPPVKVKSKRKTTPFTAIFRLLYPNQSRCLHSQRRNYESVNVFILL